MLICSNGNRSCKKINLMINYIGNDAIDIQCNVLNAIKNYSNFFSVFVAVTYIFYFIKYTCTV